VFLNDAATLAFLSNWTDFNLLRAGNTTLICDSHKHYNNAVALQQNRTNLKLQRKERFNDSKLEILWTTISERKQYLKLLSNTSVSSL
jgi:hypothetical protein